MRLESLAEKIPESVEAMPLEFLELTFSNLCNLACVGCHSELSSTWAKEDFRHGRLIGRGLVEHNYDLSHTDLSQLKFLKIIGGEPLMETKRFTDLLKRPDLDLTQLTIMFVTNGTILPNAELKELLDQCQRLKLFVSLDGIGSVNEWVRWPTKFDKIVENLNQFNSWWSNSNNVTLNIHMTVNVYNVWTLNDVGTFMYQNYPTWKSNFEWLIYPHWQAINIIPDEFKDALKSRLLEWEQTVPYNIHKAQLSPFTTTIDRLYDTPLSSWDEFKQNTQRLAKERNLNVIEMLPELVKATNLQL
jgi:sulfatase maturation enzyme AslB (radical SAM superfamily)